jgi:hypothetical protein
MLPQDLLNETVDGPFISLGKVLGFERDIEHPRRSLIRSRLMSEVDSPIGRGAGPLKTCCSVPIWISSADSSESDREAPPSVSRKRGILCFVERIPISPFPNLDDESSSRRVISMIFGLDLTKSFDILDGVVRSSRAIFISST